MLPDSDQQISVKAETLVRLVAPEQAGARLDQFLASTLDFSRARLQKLLKSGRVLVRGENRPASYRVRQGDAVIVEVPEPQPSHLIPESLNLEIIFEDRDLVVVNKPPGLVVHPGAGHRQGTLLHGLLHHCPELKEIGEKERPGLVHRLDKDTSGVIVAAKTDLAHQSLIGQFKDRTVSKKYLALVWGRLPAAAGEISQEIGRHPTERRKMSAHPRRGKPAVTRWRVLQEFPGPLTLMELSPQTGRTHQLRVHLAAQGHPVVGDATYGGGAARLGANPKLTGLKPLVKRQLLHAWKLGLTHPRTGAALAWEAPLPQDFREVVDYLTGMA